jgi:thiol reductant ABC exporter CydD subunit
MNLDRRLVRSARGARAGLATTVGLGWLAGVVLVFQAWYLARVISDVFLMGSTLPQVRPLLLVLLVLSLARAGLSWGSEVTANRVAGRVKTDLRERLSAHLLALGPAYTRGERSGELTNTVVEGVEALDAYFSQYLPQLALAALLPLTILLFVFPRDLLTGLVLLLTAPLIPIFMILIGNVAETLTRRQWTSLSRMSAHFLDVLQGLTTLKLLGRGRDQIQTIAQISDQFRQTTLGVLRVAFLSALVMEMVAAISTAVVAVEVGLRVLYGRMVFEEAFFILLLAPEFYLPLRTLSTRFHASMAGVAAAQRIYEVLGVKPQANTEVGKPQANTEVGKPQAGAEVRFEFEDDLEPGLSPYLKLNFDLSLKSIHYAYDDGERPALKGLSLQIAPGQKVALVGPSGAGKSTVAHLLLRFIEPDQGTITVDGAPLQHVPIRTWRAQVAWVPQNHYLFHASVAENVRLARPDAGLDEVIWAAEQAHAHDFIRALPQGYDTLVGERGARLSGGQAQRIALARAFLKDAPLLVMDEATANLDPEDQARIQDSMEHLMGGRTALIIAHRLPTVYRADQIVVMADGRAVESGTHETLLEKGVLYRRLVQAYGVA